MPENPAHPAMLTPPIPVVPAFWRFPAEPP